MGRPSKYNKETVALLKKFIRDGFTIRQACYGASISEDTFSRWRAKYPEFNESINEATNRQWESSLALAKYGCRTYKRPSRPVKPLENANNGSQSISNDNLADKLNENKTVRQKFHGLPIRYMWMGAEKLDAYYYDPDSGFVFWEDKQGITHTMTYEVYERKVNPTPDYYYGEIF